MRRANGEHFARDLFVKLRVLKVLVHAEVIAMLFEKCEIRLAQISNPLKHMLFSWRRLDKHLVHNIRAAHRYSEVQILFAL